MLGIRKDQHRKFSRYLGGAKVEKEDRHRIKKLTNIGMMKTGFYTDEKGQIHTTARFTRRGEKLFRHELMMQNPLKRTFFNVLRVQ
jgi:hypothetical protein